MIFKKDKMLIQPTWSAELLEKFISTCFSRTSAYPGELPLFIEERTTSIDISPNKSENYTSISYRGFLAKPGLDNIYYGLSSWEESVEEEDKNYIGYIELLNGISDNNEPVAMIRGFVRRGLGIFEAADRLLRDARLFGIKEGTVLKAHLDCHSHSFNEPDNILNHKINIKSIDAYQRLSMNNLKTA